MKIDLHSLLRGRSPLSVFLLACLLQLASGGAAQAAPPVPASPSPGSTSSPGPTVSSSTVALDWSNSSGATYYELGVRDMATNQLVVDTQVSSSAYTANLSAGKPYRWNVAACNSTGCSDYTAHRYFQTPGAVAVPATPGSPTPGSTSSPGPTVSSSTVALDWSNSTGATYYELGVRDMATNQLVVDTQVSSSAYTANLDPGKPYRWDVAACNSSGCSSATADRYFQTPASVPPVPSSPTPGSTSSPGPTVSSSTVALDWSNSTGATFYDLGVRNMATNELVIDTTVTSSAFTANLQPGTPYRWDVAACNSGGCSSPTADRYFQTPASVPAVPSSPTPGSTSSPGPMISGSNVALDWSDSSGATFYDIGVRDMSNNELVVNTQVPNSAYTADLQPGKPYKWDVAACNSAGCSSPTADRYFQTAPVPATPANPAPGSASSPGPALADPVVQLTWSASAGATSYDVGVRDLVTNVLVIDQMTGSTSLTVTLERGKPYKWDVAACIAPDCSSPTADRYFTIAAASGVPDIAISPLTLTFELDGFGFGDRSEVPATQSAEIDWTEVARLEEKARETGSVRVIVGLDAAFVPEGYLAGESLRRNQRAAIEDIQDEVLAGLASMNYRILARYYSSIPFLAVELDAAALARVVASDRVNHIHEDFAVPPTLASSGPVVGAPAAWAAGFDGAGRVVAVLDTGVDKSHPYFAGGKVVAEACFSSGAGVSSGLCPGGATSSTAAGSAAPCPANISRCDHGTHVAGIVAGNDGNGPNDGIARGANLIAVQVFSRYDNPADCAGSAPCLVAHDADLVQAMSHILNLRSTFDIAAVNLSLGGGQYHEACDGIYPDFKAAVDQLRSFGIATVVSTGNSGYIDSINWPACTSSVISVGATRDNDDLYPDGNVASFVDLMAPGVSIVSSVPGTGTDSKTGTSMATPHVAGAWAILKQKNPNASVNEILELLRETATVVEDDRPNGVVTDLRRINVDEALAAIQNGQDFVISNTGNGSLSITGLQLNQSASWISWSPQAPFTIAAGQSVSVTVTVDPGAAPAGSSSRRLLVTSNDPNESPYPNGVFINVEQTTAPDCHSLTRTHTGNGNNPSASPTSSPGCPSGQFTAGASIQLTASPASGWTVGGWAGTANNGSTSLVNQVVMPDNNHTAGVTYLENAPPEMLFDDGFESGNLDAWSVVGPVGGNIVVFSDDFNDGILDADRWTWYGHTVRETAGQFHVDCEVTDDGGGVNSQYFRIAPTGLITVSRMARVGAGNHKFDGSLRFEAGGNHFGVSYADYDYSVNGECAVQGFALYRNGANTHVCSTQGIDVTAFIPGVWGAWFQEKIEWNPATGAAAYYINNQNVLNLNVGPLPAGTNLLRLRMSTWGWYTGHYQHSDDLRVTQQVQ